MQKLPSEKFIRLPQLLDMTGGSRSWVYSEIANGRFPRPIALGKRSVAWLEKEVLEWMENRIISSRKKGGDR